MTYQFAKRLAAAAGRVADRKQSAVEQHAAAAQAQRELVARVNSVIGDWNARIAPQIIQAVAAANQALADSGVSLVHNVGSAQMFHVGAAPGPGLPSLPALAVTPALKAAAARMVNAPRPRRGGGNAAAILAALPRVTFQVTGEGKISIAAANSRISSVGNFKSKDFTEAQIEATIADFVDELTAAL
jgi:hypothetical protein